MRPKPLIAMRVLISCLRICVTNFPSDATLYDRAPPAKQDRPRCSTRAAVAALPVRLAEQHARRAVTALAGRRRREREHRRRRGPGGREPAPNERLEHGRVGRRVCASPVDDEHTAPPLLTRAHDEALERRERLVAPAPVEVEARLGPRLARLEATQPPGVDAGPARLDGLA